MGYPILPLSQRRYNREYTTAFRRMHLHHYSSIAEQFIPSGRVIDVREFGNGNINDTYLVSIDTDSTEENQFVLQRVNTQVFKQPMLIMQNMRAFTEHMRRRARQEGHLWEMPRVLPAYDGGDYYFDAEGNLMKGI